MATLFEFLRNGDLNARNFFAASARHAEAQPMGRNPRRAHHEGQAVLLRRVSAHFAALRSALHHRAFLPTAAALAGDFTTLAGPACNNGRTINLPASLGFVGNKISAASLNQVAAVNIEKLLPPSPDPVCGKVTYGLVQNQDEYVGISRLDYQKSAKHQLFTRLSVNDLDLLHLRREESADHQHRRHALPDLYAGVWQHLSHQPQHRQLLPRLGESE